MVCVGVSVGGMAPTYVPVSIAEEESQALTGPSATPSRFQHFYSTLRRPGIKTLILSSVVLQNTCFALVRRYSRGALHEKASLAQPPFFVDTESRAARRTYPIFLCLRTSPLVFFLRVYTSHSALNPKFASEHARSCLLQTAARRVSHSGCCYVRHAPMSECVS